jgi:hypothetical protein
MTYPGTMAWPQVIPGYDLRPASITNFLEYNGIQYATIINSEVDGSGSGCQDDQFLPLPDGYQVAISTPDVIANVIGDHEWGIDCPVLADGESYESPGGSSCGSDELRTRETDGVVTYGLRPGCSRAVMIQC